MARRRNKRPQSEKVRRVLIVGVSSYIGSAIAQSLREDFEVFGTYLRTPTRIEGVVAFELDCFDGNSILDNTKKLAPEAIIYCAGFNDRDRCQQEVNKADAINFKAPTIFFKLLPSTTRFMYFSTDEIFGANTRAKGPFGEKSEAAPINNWARTKFSGESLVANHKRYTATFRLGKVFGEIYGDPERPKLSWINEVQDNLDKGEEITARANTLRSYTYIGDICRAVRLYLTDHDVDPVLYNLAGPTAMSEVEFLHAFCDRFGYDKELIHGYDYEVPLSREKAATPMDCSLDSSLIAEEYGLEVQDPAEAFFEFKERLRTGWHKNWRL